MGPSPLVVCHASLKAKQRIDAAFAILKGAKDYPAERISLDSEAYTALSALADYHAGEGHPRRAVEIYEDLLARVMAGKPDPLNDLRDVPRLSRLYQALAGLYRRTGGAAKEETNQARRLDLWRNWDRKSMKLKTRVKHQMRDQQGGRAPWETTADWT